MSAALLELQALLPSVKEARNVALIQAEIAKMEKEEREKAAADSPADSPADFPADSSADYKILFGYTLRIIYLQ